MIFNHHLSSAYLLDLIPENHPTKFNSGLGPLKANMAGKSPCFMGDTLTQMGCLYVVYPIRAGSKRSSNCPCRMIALRACLRIPYAVTCLAYAGDFSDMALREAYAGTFFNFFIRPHRNCLREPVSTCAKPYTSKLNIYCVLF